VSLPRASGHGPRCRVSRVAATRARMYRGRVERVLMRSGRAVAGCWVVVGAALACGCATSASARVGRVLAQPQQCVPVELRAVRVATNVGLGSADVTVAFVNDGRGRCTLRGIRRCRCWPRPRAGLQRRTRITSPVILRGRWLSRPGLGRISSSITPMAPRSKGSRVTVSAQPQRSCC